MITLVAAIAENDCIGKNGGLPWRLPADIKRFKKLTTGKVVIMGRKTWESLPSRFRPLPDRVNVVLTKQRDYVVPTGVATYTNIDEVMTAYAGQNIIIIGGGQLYQATINQATTLEITHIHQDIPGDTFFPAIDRRVWQETNREDHGDFSFVTYKRYKKL